MTKRAAAVWLVLLLAAAATGGGSGGGGVRAEEPASASTSASAGSCEAGDGGGGDGTCKVDDATRDSHGWLRYASSFDGACSIDRVDVSEISFRSFTRTYKNKKPVILVGMRARNDAFRALSSRDRLLRDWGDTRIVLSTANTHSYDKHVKTLREYATRHMQPQRLVGLHLLPGGRLVTWTVLAVIINWMSFDCKGCPLRVSDWLRGP